MITAYQQQRRSRFRRARGEFRRARGEFRRARGKFQTWRTLQESCRAARALSKGSDAPAPSAVT
eukprot:5132369-Pyramimonas_sp.AAC.1